MKTAVSIPDAIYEKGERIARKLGLSRSALYARAIEELAARQEMPSDEDPVTAQINRVLAEIGTESTELDPGQKRLRARGLDRNDW